MWKISMLLAWALVVLRPAPGFPEEPIASATNEPLSMWLSTTLADTALPQSEGSRLTEAELAALQGAKPPLPYGEFTGGAWRLPDGALWIGSKGGVLYRAPSQQAWRLFHSRRWLPADHVLDLSLTKDGVYVKTATGTCRLSQQKKTLDQKMAEIHSELRRCHLREDLVGQIQLKKPGRLDAGWIQHDSDNDGLWTSLYVAAEAFRFATTEDPQARENAWRSLQALMFLERVTGIPGFAARSILPISHPRPTSGEWHRSADGRWWWKGDTSNDELAGHYFAYAVYFDLAATPAQKEQIRQVVGRITDHILDHGFYYVGPSGKPTRWGVWAPEKLNRELAWIGDRGLNSLEILSHLKVADHVLPNRRYARAAQELIDQHGYALNTVWQKHVWPPAVNHSDDQLAFLAYYPLLRYERDFNLRAIYKSGLERSWRIERPEQSPLFNFIYAACRQADSWKDPSRRPEKSLISAEAFDLLPCLEWFRDVPQDLIDWTVRNSDRQDLGEVIANRRRRASASRVLPVAERPLMRWNGDPFRLDGGSDGHSRDDGTFILLPFWMGKYHRFLR